MPTPTPEIAIIYDFDGTLAPGNMQENAFIPDLGLTPGEFWGKVQAATREHEGDEILMYMDQMLSEANYRGVSITRKQIREYGAELSFYPGVESWFGRINDYANALGIRPRHFIVSSGIKAMIEGSAIAHEFERVYASAFKYNANDVAEWPAVAINYTTKTQYLFRINKGALTPTDSQAINAYLPDEERPLPFNRMIFIGDGLTDIPCFRLVKDKGGHAIAVYQTDGAHGTDTAKRLKADGRVDFTAPADYRTGERLETIVRRVINKILAEEAILGLED